MPSHEHRSELLRYFIKSWHSNSLWEGGDYDGKLKLLKVNENESKLVNPTHLYNIYAMLDQCQRRWADVVWMVFKYFVFTEK